MIIIAVIIEGALHERKKEKKINIIGAVYYYIFALDSSGALYRPKINQSVEFGCWLFKPE